MKSFLDLAGRILLAALFLVAGIGKVGDYAGTQAYMASQGVPGVLLPAVIALELGGAALLFHANFADPMQQIMFLKNLSIAGGFLLLAANGASAWSVDPRRRKEVES